MAKVTFQDEEGQYLNRYKMIPVEGQPNVYDLERAANITKQGTPYNKEVGDHFLQVEDKGVPGGVASYDAALQSATLGGSPVPKSGTILQLPAYPTSLPANGGNAATLGGKSESQLSVNYAASAGSAPAAGGWSSAANYPTHSVGINEWGLRGNYIANWGPSGGYDGDTWDQY